SAPADRIGVIAGDLQDAESMKAALDLFSSLGVTSLDCRQDGAALGDGPRESWLFNSTLAGIENADVVLIVGANPRLDAPVLNQRLRKQWVAGKMRLGVVGEALDLTYDYDRVGEGASDLSKLSGAFADAFKAAERPAIIVGAAALNDAGTLAAVAKLADDYGVIRDGWNGWNVLHTAAARVGGLDLGFTPKAGGKSAAELVAKGGADVLFLLGADEIDLSETDAFVVYLGTHGDTGAHKADVVLPGAAYTEKDGLYVNTEGRVQMGARAVFPKGEAREDWAILRALSERLGATLPYDTLSALRARLFADHPTFGQIDFAPGSVVGKPNLSKLGGKAKPAKGPFAPAKRAFHLTNPIARASVTMAECASLAAGQQKQAAE
ncbi:MAG: molybdopterin-dependent oxidoreductase, partial [Caulobacterales bacterium]|nr:molybdopterin-dependent oxidoreductase [Caulobacterales bacterium]